MQCLVLSNKEVKAAVDELTEVLGNEDAAYYIISENNGYSIDRAPNGEPSELFSALLSYFQGDRNATILAKSKVFTEDFKTWFGDWLGEDKTNVSKVVDNNGEPLVMYHGTDEQFVEFNIKFFGKTDEGDRGRGFYFAPHVDTASRYGNNVMPVYLNIKTPFVGDPSADKYLGRGKTKNELTQDEKDYLQQRKLQQIQLMIQQRDSNTHSIAYEKFGINDNDSNQTIEDKVTSWYDSYYTDDYFLSKYNNFDEADGYMSGYESVVYSPNQVKSVDNQGTFSTESNNIHETEQKKPIMYQYHPAEEFASFYITNNGYGTATSGELASRLSAYLMPDSTARRLIQVFSQTNVPVTFQKLGTETEAKYMYYNAKTHEIVINTDKFNYNLMGDNAESLFHELVHAYTSRTLLRVKSGQATPQEQKIYDTLVELLDKYAEHFKDKKYARTSKEKVKFHDEYYGLNNIYEFAAELLTNPDFMSVLKTRIPKNDKFWSKVWDFIKYIGELLHITKSLPKQLQDDLYDLVTYNVENNVTEQDFIDTNSDLLFRQEQAIHNVEDALSRAKDDLVKSTHSITQGILNSLTTRLKVYHNSDPVIEQQTKKSMEWQVANITQELATEYDSINNFLREADNEIKTICNMLVKVKRAGRTLSNERLNELNEDFFSFYPDLIDNIVDRLGYREEYRDIIGKDSEGHYRLDTLLNRARNYQTMLNESKVVVKSQIALNAAKILEDVGVEVGAAVIYKYDELDQATYSKDASSFTWVFGAGDKIKDEAIKTIFYLMNSASEKTRQQKYAKQAKLKALLDKINKYNQLQFFEVDDNGNTTGYFVRSRNYGKFEKDYKEAMNNICMSLGIDITDLNLPENREVRIEYNRQRNRWLSQHCERRFTADYYDAFNHLSNEAQSQRESIQAKIRVFTTKGRDEYGIFRIERLDPEERQQLKQLQLEKKQLASIYDICGRKKVGIQLQVAQELTELNQKLSKGLTYTRNSDAFEKEKARIMASKELTKEQKEEWLDLNTREQYSDEFYDKLKKLARKNYGEEYAALQERRRALLAMFRDDLTGEINAETMPIGTKQALRAISRRMTQLRKIKKPTAIEGEFEFDEIAEVVPTKQWYIDKRRYHDMVANEDPDTADAWLKANAYTVRTENADGTIKVKIVPKSWYTKMVPKDKTLIERVPNNNWLEVSSESPYYNKAYYQAQQEHPDLKDEYWIPKKNLYNSEDRYNTIMNNPDMKVLYEELLNTMAEANAAYSNLTHVNPYRAPQMSGSLYRYVSSEVRASQGLGKVTAPFRGWANYIKDKLSIRNDDRGFNKPLAKPNGERLNLIPQNYIRDIETPEAINADVVGSVIQYYAAAMEWQNKKDIQPRVELLKAHVLGKKYTNGKGEVKTGESNIAKFIKSFVDMNLYDIRQQTVTVGIGGNKSGKLLGVVPYKGSIFNLINYDISKPREINITKMLAILRMLGTTTNLALNLWCALTGLFTALHGHIVNTLVGRYYNPVNAAYALKDILVDLLLNVPNKVGLTTRVSQLSQKMEYFEVGATPDLNPTNRNTLVNMFTKHWGFGIYSFSDHLIKGQILSSIMYDYKLVEIDGKKKFMSREEYKKVKGLDVFKPGDVLDWNFGDKLSFNDATHIVAGELKAKDPANQAAVDAVKNQIGYLARQLAQSADGQLTDLQRSVIFSNAMGQFVMMHRQYFPVLLQERYTMSRQLDYQTQRWREATFRTPFRIIHDAMDDKINLWVAFKRAYTNDPAARENLKKVPIELTIWTTMLYLLIPLLSSSADDDRRNWLLQLITYALEKTTFEISAPWNLLDLISLVKNPSPILNYFDTMIAVGTVPIDALFDSVKSLFSDEKSEEDRVITRGTYRGFTKEQRNLINLTPAKNIVRLRDIKSQRDYYNNVIRGIKPKKRTVNIDELNLEEFE